MGFFDTTTKKEFGKCIYCGAPMIGKVRDKDGKVIDYPDATTMDGKTFMCPTCYKSKDLVAEDISLKDNKKSLLAFLKKNIWFHQIDLHLLKGFTGWLLLLAPEKI